MFDYFTTSLKNKWTQKFQNQTNHSSGNVAGTFSLKLTEE